MYRLMFRNTAPLRDPLKTGRNPLQVFLLLLCAVSGLPLVFNYQTSGSVEELLPFWLTFGWGFMLFAGSGMALLGIGYPFKHFATSLTLERIGLDWIGIAGSIYVLCILLIAGRTGFLAATIVAGFAFSCLRRSWEVAGAIKRAVEISGGAHESD